MRELQLDRAIEVAVKHHSISFERGTKTVAQIRVAQARKPDGHERAVRMDSAEVVVCNQPGAGGATPRCPVSAIA